MIKKILNHPLARSSTINAGSRLLVLAVSIGFISYLSRKIDQTELGVFVLLFVFQGLMAMMDNLGLPSSAIRMIPELEAKGEIETTGDLVQLSLFLPAAMGLILLATGLLAQGPLASIFLKSPGYEHYLFWILVNGFASSLYDKTILIHQALQWFRKLALLNIFTFSLQRVAALLLFLMGYGLHGAFVGFLFGTLIGLGIAILSLRRYLFRRYAGYSAKHFVKFSVPFYCQGYARYAYSQVDQTMVAVLFAPDILAIYFIIKRIASLVTLVFEGLLDPVIPKLAEMKARGVDVFETHNTQTHRTFSLIILVGVLIVFFNAKAFLLFLGGSPYLQYHLLLSILTISVFFYGIFLLNSLSIYLLEAPQKVLMLFTVAGGINTVSGILLGWCFGLIGFVIAQSFGFIGGILLVRYKLRHHNAGPNPSRFPVMLLVVSFGFGAGYVLNNSLTLSSQHFDILRIILANGLFIGCMLLCLKQGNLVSGSVKP